MDHRDPRYTGYYPKTCEEAITLFYKKRDLGEIIWDDVDEVFRHCAKKLNQEEFSKFASWIVNPTGVTASEKCPIPASGMCEQDEKTQ